jgi:hypothetical protein
VGNYRAWGVEFSFENDVSHCYSTPFRDRVSNPGLPPIIFPNLPQDERRYTIQFPSLSLTNEAHEASNLWNILVGFGKYYRQCPRFSNTFNPIMRCTVVFQHVRRWEDERKNWKARKEIAIAIGRTSCLKIYWLLECSPMNETSGKSKKKKHAKNRLPKSCSDTVVGFFFFWIWAGGVANRIHFRCTMARIPQENFIMKVEFWNLNTLGVPKKKKRKPNMKIRSQRVEPFCEGIYRKEWTGR